MNDGTESEDGGSSEPPSRGTAQAEATMHASAKMLPRAANVLPLEYCRRDSRGSRGEYMVTGLLRVPKPRTNSPGAKRETSRESFDRAPRGPAARRRARQRRKG